MNREFFTYLPRDVIINILSRLPIRTIIHCKCVCKSWLHLVETHDFVNYHLSKSVPGLAIHQSRKSLESIKIFEFEDEPDLDYHELHYNPVTQFDLSYLGWVEGSANGLLFVRDLFVHPNGLYICNPITRDYIQLHSPQDFVYSYPQVVTYGFGVSKINGQYKVVRIFQDCMRDQSTRELLRISKSECLVYTLGSGSWRRIAPGPLLEYSRITTGTFLNGNLHWLVFDLNGSPWISCFDLETETFSTISAPLASHGRDLVGPYALRDCICLCDYSSDDEIVIWLMKEFGVEQYWTKEFVISKIPDIAGESYATVCPIKVFKDGDILMAWDNKFLFYYSYRTNTTQKLNMLDKHICISASLHTSSFVSLKNFAMENVSSF